MRVLIPVLMALIVATLAGPARAADFEKGCEAFDRGEFERALEEWQPLAEQGHPQAQFRLGCLYAFGQGVETDYGTALDLYRDAAEQGDPDAQNNLGSMLALGWGTEPDPVEGWMWLEVAARTGHDMATRNRDFLGERMEPAQLEEARRRADEYAARRATN